MKLSIKAKNLEGVEKVITDLSDKFGRQLVKRTYRITKQQDRIVKKLVKKFYSQSEVIRNAILELEQAYHD